MVFVLCVPQSMPRKIMEEGWVEGEDYALLPSPIKKF
jgi:hypothetical protein